MFYMRFTTPIYLSYLGFMTEITIYLTTFCTLFFLLRLLKFDKSNIFLFRWLGYRFSILTFLYSVSSINCLILLYISKSDYTFLYIENKIALNQNYFDDFLNYNFIGFYDEFRWTSLWKEENIDIDSFGLILIFLANYVGSICRSTLDTRLRQDNINYSLTILYFNLVLLNFVATNNFINFFVLYELLLLPSFLMVYFTGYSRRTIHASIYFLVWTQLGSLLVLCGFLILICCYNIESFDSNWAFNRGFTKWETLYKFAVTLMIIGFGVKIPFWPFHYWITKTHVEAPTGFSIYLSGFLVKTAVFGIFKTTALIGFDFCLVPFYLVIILGIFDSSIKFWTQMDIKKLVAYCTVQEMNMIIFLFLFGQTTKLIPIGLLFLVTHALLSALMFYVVDCVYRRFHSRNLIDVHGIYNLCPNLATSVILMQICFVGLPGTSKFVIEVSLLSSLMYHYPITLTIILIINLFAILAFSKIWYNLIFGVRLEDEEVIYLDLSTKELSIIAPLIILQVFFTYFHIFLLI